MRKLVRLRLATALALSGAGGCSNFLSTDKVKLDPNNPSTATADQLFVAVQAGQFAQQEGIIALIGCMWIQQCTGTSNSADEAPATRLLWLRPTRRLSVSTGRAWIREAKRQST